MARPYLSVGCTRDPDRINFCYTTPHYTSHNPEKASAAVTLLFRITMKLFSILSFVCLAAVAILPSASALEKTANVRRHTTSTTKSITKKDRPDVRALQERFSEVLAAKAKAPLGAVATESHQRSRELQDDWLGGLIDFFLSIFGIGGDEDEEDGDFLGLVFEIIDILIPALTSGESDDLVLALLAAILPFLRSVFDDPLIDIILDLVEEILIGDESLDENRGALADDLAELEDELARRR